MEKEFIPYEQALALKELAFDEPCIAYYHSVEYSFVKDLNRGGTTRNSEQNLYDNDRATPTYSQAFRWFREKYQIENWIYPNLNSLYSVSIIRRGVGLEKVYEYQTYEEAELECLKKLIEIVKNK